MDQKTVRYMGSSPKYPEKVYLNGKILDADQAQISVFDRGFIFGDGIYEVMARINGRFFFKKAHLDRLKWCLKQIDISLDVDALEREIPALLQASGLDNKDCLLYMQVSRGVAPRQHSFPKGIRRTVMMYAWEKKLPDINNNHASVVTMADFRWSRCDIKMTSLLGNVMANEHAMQNDCYETVFERNGIITEASHCNVFFVKDGVVYTHPTGPYLLDGITRQVVLELCEQLAIEVRLEGVPASEIQNMDEAFLTGTSTQVLAIQKVDDYSYFEKEPGPLTQKLQQAFLGLKRTV
ncbi:aminotransferase class IV [Lentiprolixibacter aurantiacus]|uniref:Aminotransferase class IV n=1 Tax=Lentiprolixibacter aurantiacus TaxID=2993939 RepID=A0AAE3SM75_9FLAO|nr:aminotransferase class IV [Lentiprolixibacter aurantiacus]MCX2718437.1 aminotransferase class IV [Lentiprolixibacter aurantiacus]